MRDGPLRRVIEATLDERSVRRRGLFRPEAVGRCVAEFFASQSGSPAAGHAEARVWTLVMLELWCRMFDAGAVWGHIPHYLAGFRQHGAAKGSDSKWLQMYRDEEEMLRQKYPRYCADNLKHKAGLLWYRAGQMLGGRHLLAMRDTRRFRGRTLAEAFGNAR